MIGFRPNGRKFTVTEQNVGINESEDADDMQVGDVVTFSYSANARREVPVDPTITRVRHDLRWEHVLAEDYKQSHLHQSRSDSIGAELSHEVANYSEPSGHWSDKGISEKNKSNMRNFFENIARRRNLDPLLPDTWYSIPRKEVEQTRVSPHFICNIF